MTVTQKMKDWQIQYVQKRNKGHDIAMKALGASHDYSKSKTLRQLNSSLLERDTDLITISKQFLDEEKHIEFLKLQVQDKNREIAWHINTCPLEKMFPHGAKNLGGVGFNDTSAQRAI